MLGKGLESLIPQKGNGNGNGNGTNNNGGPSSHQPPAPNLNPANPATPPAQPAPTPAFSPSPERAHVQPEPSQPAEPALPPPERNVELPSAAAFPPVEPERKPNPPAPRVAPEEPRINESVFHIEVEKIKPNPNQPRRIFDDEALNDLASSIREFGFLQPLVVSKVEKETASGIEVEYQLIAGERRFMAAKRLGLAAVPAIIRNVNLEREKLELAVIENIQRENLNPIETARAFQRLQEEFRMTQREIAAKLGKSREAVANTVRLLDLPEYIREAVEKHEISESHARLLLSIPDPGAQRHLFDDIIRNHLTTREVKDRVLHETAAAVPSGAGIGMGAAAGHLSRRGRPPKADGHLSPELQALQDSLSMDLGAPVEIYKGQAKGSITITFFSEEELRAIMQRLGKEGM